MQYHRRMVQARASRWVGEERTQVMLEGEILLELDLDAIIRELGTKALKSKGGRSVAMGGLIKAKRKSVKEKMPIASE